VSVSIANLLINYLPILATMSSSLKPQIDRWTSELSSFSVTVPSHGDLESLALARRAHAAASDANDAVTEH